jgi:hypothetical protein
MDAIMRWFKYDHLPDHLRPMVISFADLAEYVVMNTLPGPERSTALRKLLEGKDAAIRALIESRGE